MPCILALVCTCLIWRAQAPAPHAATGQVHRRRAITCMQGLIAHDLCEIGHSTRRLKHLLSPPASQPKPLPTLASPSRRLLAPSAHSDLHSRTLCKRAATPTKCRCSLPASSRAYAVGRPPARLAVAPATELCRSRSGGRATEPATGRGGFGRRRLLPPLAGGGTGDGENPADVAACAVCSPDCSMLRL